MSKDNAKNNYSSTNYAKILIIILIKREREKRNQKKMHLPANRFKGLEKTFTNNGVESSKNYHFSFSSFMEKFIMKK
jgi:hypothetical protein